MPWDCVKHRKNCYQGATACEYCSIADWVNSNQIKKNDNWKRKIKWFKREKRIKLPNCYQVRVIEMPKLFEKKENFINKIIDYLVK